MRCRTLKKQNNLSALANKIAHRSVRDDIENKFAQADEILGVGKEEYKERVIRKSYALTLEDVAAIQLIKDKCLNQKVVLNDSHTIRLALMLAAKLSEDQLVKAVSHLPKVTQGRPKNS